MNCYACSIIVCLSLPLFGTSVWANPFGFETQTDPETYPFCKKVHPVPPETQSWIENIGLARYDNFRGVVYGCSSAPRPHPEFKEYFLSYTATQGLCEIEAKSFLQRRLPAVEIFKDQLVLKYGGPSETYERTKPLAFYPTEPSYSWDALPVKPITRTPQGWITFRALGNEPLRSIVFYITRTRFREYDWDEKRYMETDQEGFAAEIIFSLNPTCDQIFETEAAQAF